MAQQLGCSIYQMKKQLLALESGRCNDETFWRPKGRPPKKVQFSQ